MNRSLLLSSVLAVTIMSVTLPLEGGQPAVRITLSGAAGSPYCTRVSATVGRRLVLVDRKQQTEIEIKVRRLPPDKRATIYVELQPESSEERISVPMSLPIGHWLRLVNVNSGHCLGVINQSLDAGAKLVQDDIPPGDRGALWRLVPVASGWYALQNRCTEQVASLPDSRKNAGANLVQVPLDSGSTDQQWRPLWLEGNRFVVVNRRSGQALAVAYGAKTPGATICQWPLHIDWGQHQWRIEVNDPE